MSKKDMDRRKKFILELMGDPIYQPMRLREISSLLRLSKEEKRELYDVLDELCEEGKVSVDRKGRYEKVKGKWKKKKMTVITMTEEKNTDQSMAERRKIKIKR